MSSAQFNAGRDRAQAQNKTEQVMESAKSTASAAHDKASQALGRTPQKTQQCKEENASFLQQSGILLVLQTGEQMTHVAQGAIDGVKNTLGMGEKK